MDEALVQAVTDRIWAAWGSGRPPALLLGREPAEDLGYRYVSEPPFDAIVIGSLTPGQLLYFRDERVLEALLEAWGVVFWDGPTHRRLISAGEARRLKEQGKKPPAGAVLTPLAREILEQP